MKIYRLGNKLSDSIKKIEETPFKSEKEIQTLVEHNLMDLLGLEFVCTEFSVRNYRIDTLAFDIKTSSFVIIEYKKDRNFSVIDQGFTYLETMKDNKADFVIKYIDKNEQKRISINEINWNRSKVIFVSTEFTNYQKGAIGSTLSIELWEIKKLNNQTISFRQIQKTSINRDTKDSPKKEKTTLKNIKNSTKTNIYTEEYHLQRKHHEIRKLYEKFKLKVISLDKNISIIPKKTTIGFNINNNVLCDLILQKTGLKIYINLKHGELNDIKKMTKDISNIGHLGQGDYQIKLNTSSHIDYVVELINQAVLKKLQKIYLISDLWGRPITKLS